MNCTFPVSVDDSPECILLAFKQSGYFDQLNPQQQESATRDPRGWLASHPYLYMAIPQYFTEKKQLPTITTTPSGQQVQTPAGPQLSSLNPILNPITPAYPFAGLGALLGGLSPFSQQVTQTATQMSANTGGSIGAEFEAIGRATVSTITGIARVPGEALKSLFEAGAAFEKAPLGSLAVLGIILLLVLFLFILK